ncbi:hypothetical protein PFLU3_48370 [Pseudomonas fluorescens]|uniref:Uncharacterized protein n=1 Tax=Pseudomonas fluorescens TaxID=294 RepID=A0A0D0RJS6_PSEFL|nr:hypothetical protein PFLU3_48370 [Pseudomonas fluorescens]
MRYACQADREPPGRMQSKCGRGGATIRLAPDSGGSAPDTWLTYLYLGIGIYTTDRADLLLALAFAFALLLILGAPSNHAGRNSTGIWGVNRQGCRFSRPAPWMARGGAPPNPWRITGTPSLGEVPSGGARAFWLLLRFSKVTRCKSGTNSSRYRSNGYVLGMIQHPGRLSGRHRGQVESSHRPSHILDLCIARYRV